MIVCRRRKNPRGGWVSARLPCSRPEGRDSVLSQPHRRVIAGRYRPAASFVSELANSIGGDVADVIRPAHELVGRGTQVQP